MFRLRIYMCAIEMVFRGYNAGGFILTEGSGALSIPIEDLFKALRSDSRSQGISAPGDLNLLVNQLF